MSSGDRSCILASLRVGEGAAGPTVSPLAGGGAPPRPCPLCDKPEVSGDQDTLSWVQGAAQGVVTGGYLGRPCAGTARKPASRRPALGAGHGVDSGLPFRLGL